MTKHYFAADGNYGDAHNGVVVDTERFTESDWEEIENAHDSERADVAIRISGERNNSWSATNYMVP